MLADADLDDTGEDEHEQHKDFHDITGRSVGEVEAFVDEKTDFGGEEDQVVPLVAPEDYLESEG